jgi:hypothetical protein
MSGFGRLVSRQVVENVGLFLDNKTVVPNGYWVFPEGKAGRGVALTTHPHIAPRLRKE